MIAADFILLIFNCKKYSYKAKQQKETWLKHFDKMPFFHVIGDPKLTTNYIFNNEEHILYLKVEDDYNSLPKKVIYAYESIYNTYNFKYIFKTDDDQNVENDKFFNIIQNLLLNTDTDKKIHYAGQIVNVDKPYLSEYYKIHPELPSHLPILKTKYCTGRFYVLSQLAIQFLLTKKENICEEFLEDYAIGLNLDAILKKNMLHIQTDKYFIDFPIITNSIRS